MYVLSLGQLNNIVRYHFGNNAYRDKYNKKDKKRRGC